MTESDPATAALYEAKLIGNVRQLTFEGARAGEGYFSRDGSRMVFQSEREPGNPFFQIYLLDLDSGDTVRVSPGHGKTTCGWIHPDGNRVLFASTHDDPDARKKQADELELRKSGQQRRYSWDYDEHYELYAWDQKTGVYTNLTNTRGYDAEGSWSPDGRWIAFTSNRLAYTEPMTDEQKKQFELDPAYMNDIYLMAADGSNVRRLTDVPGYDGGPFFSPDGQADLLAAILARRRHRRDHDDEPGRFRPAAADAHRRHVVGPVLSSVRRIPDLYDEPARVWELRTVPGRRGRATRAGEGQPHQGLRRLAGVQSRWPAADLDQQPDEFRPVADLPGGLEPCPGATTAGPGQGPCDVCGGYRQRHDAAAAVSKTTSADFAPQDIMRHVDYLCRPELEGRLTGSRGEQLATAYVAAYMDNLGLQPGGDDGTFFQAFEFTSGVALGKENSLAWGDRRYEVDKDFLPVSFSKTGPGGACVPWSSPATASRRRRTMCRPNTTRSSTWTWRANGCWCSATCPSRFRPSAGSSWRVTPACGTRRCWPATKGPGV